MSNTNNTMQTQTSNALHNAIMEAGGKDRLPMLAPGSTETTTERYMENDKNVSQDIRDQLNSEDEAVQIILTGIDHDIYSTVDACPNFLLQLQPEWQSEHPEQSKSINDTYPIEQDEHNVIIDSLDMCYDREHADQDDDDLANERDLLASLIKKLKCEIDDSKNHNKFLETSNKVLVDKVKDLKKFQAELNRHHDVKYASNVEINCSKAKGDLISYKMESEKS
nr:hypothetical protein [Tanacetum cinerariifolium]